jgi:hypothetical protein
MSDEITLEFEIPGREAPGFLKRQREALKFRERMQGDVTPETLDDLVDYLAQFVTSPAEKADKVAALWEASEAQFMTLLNALTGGDENPTQ